MSVISGASGEVLDGAWINNLPRSVSGRPWTVIDSYTEEPIATVRLAGAEDVSEAVRAARAALPSWRAMSPANRAELIVRIKEALATKADLLAELITREVGMPIALSRRMQVGAPLAILDMYARHADLSAAESRIGNSTVIRQPVGVVGAIIAWNYPLYLLASKVGAALAAGCTVVLKASELAPLSAIAFAEAAAEAGLPAGVFNLIVGTGDEAGEALVAHPDVDHITFTGSTRAGRRVASVAGERVRPVSLELGGKSASLLLDDAPLATAVKATVNSCMLNAGQTCAALTRLLVPEAMYEEAAAAAVAVATTFVPGNPHEPTTKLGPLISALQRDRVRSMIESAIRDGSELLCGGSAPPDSPSSGFFVRPTIFGRVDPSSAIAQEEVFGPVLCVIPYHDEEQALEIANGTRYGLSGAVWSADVERAERVARQMQAGQVDINGGPFNLDAPFGGFKDSGVGRELGAHGLAEFLQWKALQMPVSRSS